jgi:ACT domain-containing protein
MTGKKKPHICIVTIVGADHVGIVAKLATLMARANVNILDITQKVFEETFVMTMAVDIAAATVDMETLKQRLDRVEKQMVLNIAIQDANLFKAMHRV